MGNRISVVIADDHAIVRTGLRALLESQADLRVVGEADDGETAVSAAVRLRPDVTILDLVMPVRDGAEATAEIRARRPEAKILILTTFCDSDGLRRALDAGAAGALLKNTSNDALLSSIRRIAAGERVVSDEIRRLFLGDSGAPALSPRQAEVLAAVARGLTNAEIATTLGISPNSVKEYLSTAFERIGAANRAEAVTIALRENLLKV